jgi:hypothetical protein
MFDQDFELQVNVTKSGTTKYAYKTVYYSLGKATGELNSLPTEFILFQNYPNPFNPETVICYNLPKAGTVELTILNIMGQTVRILVRENQPAGWYHQVWAGTNDQGGKISSGLYLYKLTVMPHDGTEAFIMTKKMLLSR